jgi:hypothetical protein
MGNDPGRLHLGELSASILDFEYRWRARQTTAHPGPKEAAIRSELDLSPARYHQLLNSLLDHEAALARYPVMVNRLRTAREARRVARR